jgi:hypothetical protein
VLLLAAYFGSLSAENTLEMRRLEALRRRAEDEVRALRGNNHALIAEARALQRDSFYIELTMRRKLRWVRPGELRLDRLMHSDLLHPGAQVVRSRSPADLRLAARTADTNGVTRAASLPPTRSCAHR